MAWSPGDLPRDFSRIPGSQPNWSAHGGQLSVLGAGASQEQLLAAWVALLYKHSGNKTLVLGAPKPVRVTVDPDATFAELVTTVAGAETATDVADRPQIWFGRGAGDAVTGGLGEIAVTVSYRSVRAVYDSSVFESATIDRLVSHYRILLERALRSPSIRIQALVSPPSSEPAQSPETFASATLPSTSADLAPALAGNQTLVGQFRAVASTYPGHLAVWGPGGSFTYQELDEASDRLAAQLRPLAGPGDLVALFCGHDIGAVVAVLAVLKVGAAYVPLDPRQPSARLSEILSDVFPAAVVCDPELNAAAVGLAGGSPVLTVATDCGAHTLLPADRLGDAPDSLAYILHTSGSTGRPKGVMQSNRNVLAHASRFAVRLGIGPDDRLPMVARVAFDGAVLDIFGALLSGASLYILDPYATGLNDLLAKLTEFKMTLLHCTPTLLRYLIGQADKNHPVPALRWVALGGEEVTGEDVAGVGRCFPGAKLLNGFGASECTIALQHVTDSLDARRSTVPLGRAVMGIEERLIDPMGGPAEVFGELVLVGEAIALGYWNQPELTASAFGIGPDGIRYYRTGDLARRRPDGNLVYCGRLDFQVKIRGHRVEPGEAEVMLRAHPTVRQAAVVADIGGERGPRLIGYVTSPGPLGASSAELLEYLRRYLPDYAVPAAIVVLKKFPIGPTGKLERSLLTVPAEEYPDVDDMPWSALERRMAEVWRQVLSRKTAGVRDNFFASGGDSLLVMKLLDAIDAEFRVTVPLQAFLSAPTLQTLVDHVAAIRVEPDDSRRGGKRA